MKQSALNQLVIYFAGDSGDGIQVAGNQFAQDCAIFGNDVNTFPDYPAEIRAPQGTLAGVSGFQMCFANSKIHTPGDQYDILVAFNPAAFLKCQAGLKKGGLLIIDESKFTEKECSKLGATPDQILGSNLYKVIALPMTALTLEALSSTTLTRSGARKCKNLFALGVICWLTHRSLEPIKTWIKHKFAGKEELIHANTTALRTGYDYAVTVELFTEQLNVAKATLEPGRYRQITGNEAICLGALSASSIAQKPLFMAGYPITPASDILHTLAKMHDKGVTTFQAEDEMAAIGASLGASFGGCLGLTATSGPGMDLKSETLGLAVMAELPLVVVNVQRAGPSTGMPTKVEQADLMSSVYGRHGECPMPILAPATPGECFSMMVWAFKIAVEHMTPVIVLSDANLANSMQAWQIPNIASLPGICVPEHQDEEFSPYMRNQNLARPWISPGVENKMHRLGGLEKDADGNISYDAQNHETMTALRAQKVAKAVQALPEPIVEGDVSGDCLLIGWGSTYGALKTALEQLKPKNKIGLLHLRVLYPLADSIKDIASRYQHVLVAELNHGQLCSLLRSQFLIDAKALTQVQGKPFNVETIVSRVENLLEQNQCKKISA